MPIEVQKYVRRENSFEHLHVLEMVESCSGRTMPWTPQATPDRFMFLQWWKSSGLELKWSSEAIDYASEKGRLDVLEWWQDSGLEMKWNWKAFEKPIEDGNIKVLSWWKAAGLEFDMQSWESECTGMVEVEKRPVFLGHRSSKIVQVSPDIPMFSIGGRRRALNSSILHMRSTGRAAMGTLMCWWKGCVYNMLWSQAAIDQARIDGHICIFDWWKSSGLEAMVCCCNQPCKRFQSNWITGLVEIQRIGAEVQQRRVGFGDKRGHLNALEWWKSSGLEMKWTDRYTCTHVTHLNGEKRADSRCGRFSEDCIDEGSREGRVYVFGVLEGARNAIYFGGCRLCKLVGKS
ncbi:hypothetical protein BJ742DRAFT_802637 [Cladochytrium replicatum]|nr:hypothetical protein BJ742DRAFT_802637 [Cladochytrium replicatum]